MHEFTIRIVWLHRKLQDNLSFASFHLEVIKSTVKVDLK